MARRIPGLYNTVESGEVARPMPPVKKLIFVAVAAGLIFLLFKLYLRSQQPDPNEPIVMPAIQSR